MIFGTRVDLRRRSAFRIRRSTVLRALVVAAIALDLLAVLRLALRTPPPHLRLGSGVSGGTWDALGADLAALIESGLPGASVEVVRTEGSIDDVERIQRGDLDLAFVQNDNPGGADVRVVAPLYDNVLHLVVREGIESVADLKGRAVAIGAADSGTALSTGVVLDHLGLSGSAVKPRHLDTAASFAAFDAGEVDAIFHFSAQPGIHVNELRRRAFEDLVRERVSADESFRIFQTFLQNELLSIRDRLGD